MTYASLERDGVLMLGVSQDSALEWRFPKSRLDSAYLEGLQRRRTTFRVVDPEVLPNYLNAQSLHAILSRADSSTGIKEEDRYLLRGLPAVPRYAIVIRLYHDRVEPFAYCGQELERTRESRDADTGEITVTKLWRETLSFTTRRKVGVTATLFDLATGNVAWIADTEGVAENTTTTRLDFSFEETEVRDRKPPPQRESMGSQLLTGVVLGLADAIAKNGQRMCRAPDGPFDAPVPPSIEPLVREAGQVAGDRLPPMPCRESGLDNCIRQWRRQMNL